jgi:hypothetical protein
MALSSGVDWRVAVLRSMVICGFAALAITEAFSLIGWLKPVFVRLIWLSIFAVTAGVVYKHHHPQPSRAQIDKTGIELFDTVLLAIIAGIAALTLLTALLSPPNNVDVLAYHLPRVVYWAQAGTVAFFPTNFYP